MSPDKTNERDLDTERIDDIQTQLIQEFDGRVAPEVVQQSLSASLDGYSAVKIRDFVPLFVYRETRERLMQNSATQ